MSEPENAYPVTEFERGLAYGKMCSDIDTLKARISRLEMERETAVDKADAALTVATDALIAANEAQDDADAATETVEDVADAVETALIVDAIEDAVEDAVEDTATEHTVTPGEDEVIVIGDDEPAHETATAPPEPAHEPTQHRHRRGGVYGRRR
jgi:hypothetical protein